MDPNSREAKVARIESKPATERRDLGAIKAEITGHDPVGGGDSCAFCGGPMVWHTEKADGGAITAGRCSRCGKSPE